jgi:hypothetical protein
MGLGYFDTETSASSTFGSVVCLAGVIGTPLGGMLLDYSIRDSNERLEESFYGEEELMLSTNDANTIKKKTEDKKILSP